MSCERFLKNPYLYASLHPVLLCTAWNLYLSISWRYIHNCKVLYYNQKNEGSKTSRFQTEFSTQIKLSNNAKIKYWSFSNTKICSCCRQIFHFQKEKQQQQQNHQEISAFLILNSWITHIFNRPELSVQALFFGKSEFKIFPRRTLKNYRKLTGFPKDADLTGAALSLIKQEALANLSLSGEVKIPCWENVFVLQRTFIKCLLGTRQTGTRSLEWGRRASLLLCGAHHPSQPDASRCTGQEPGRGVPGPAPPAPPGLASHQHGSPREAASTVAKWTNLARRWGDSTPPGEAVGHPPLRTNARITPGWRGRGGRGGPLRSPRYVWRVCGGWGTPRDSGGSSGLTGVRSGGSRGSLGGRAGVLRAPGAFLGRCLWEALRLRKPGRCRGNKGPQASQGREGIQQDARGGGWLGREPATETPPQGHSRSGTHPNSPRRKEWEALTRFSASAISCTASRSFPALSMLVPAAATTSTPGSDAPSAPSPFSPRGGERRRGAQGLSGLVVPGRALTAGMGEASTTIPRRP